MSKKSILIGFAILGLAVSLVQAQGGFLSGLGEFDTANYTAPKRIGLSVGGVATVVGGLVLREYLGTAIPLPEAVTKQVQAKDIAETLAALGALTLVAAGFKHGPKQLATTIPNVAQLAVVDQFLRPGDARRHELLTILGGGVGLTSVSDIANWVGDVFEDKEEGETE